ENPAKIEARSQERFKRAPQSKAPVYLKKGWFSDQGVFRQAVNLFARAGIGTFGFGLSLGFMNTGPAITAEGVVDAVSGDHETAANEGDQNLGAVGWMTIVPRGGSKDKG